MSSSAPPSPAVADFVAAVAESIADARLIALTLAKPCGELSKTTVRVTGERFQLAWQIGPREFHQNVDADGLIAWLHEHVPASFLHAHAFFVNADVSLLVSKKGKATLQRKSPSKSRPVDAAHNKTRQYLIPEGTPCPFLEAVGVMRPDGSVPKAKQRKFKQINRFLELVDDAYDALPADGTLSVVEFGSGKSHLTFALHHLLTTHHRRDVRMTSIDRMTSVVDAARGLTKRLRLDGITHHAAEIANVTLETPVHLAVWLHACDTATDDAIAKSIQANADVILAVPCCQHEVFHAMQSASLVNHYGLLKERYAALATDALRAAALEIHGYKTQVVEFIDLEHTAKNVLLRAVKRSQPADPTPWRKQYEALKRDLGLTTWHLETVLPSLAS